MKDWKEQPLPANPKEDTQFMDLATGEIFTYKAGKWEKNTADALIEVTRRCVEYGTVGCVYSGQEPHLCRSCSADTQS